MISPGDILKANLLIVDDQEANLSLLEQMLSEAGYTSITSTRNSLVVCDLHRQNRYDLILLDLEMPGLDGFQVLEGLKQLETDGYLPVLVITAQPGHKLRALRAGARDFVSKPFELAEVLIRVQNMVEVRLLHREIKTLNAELEQRVLQRTAELEAANKELAAFSYSVAHDLRAPANTINRYSEVVLSDFGPALPETARHYLERIGYSANRMSSLIDALLAFAGLSRQALNKVIINTGLMVQEALAELGSPWPDRQVEIQLAELPPSFGDQGLIKQVWMNLLSNALKYTRKREKAVIEVGCIKTEAGTVIFIRDNGRGFDMRFVEKIFGVFERLHLIADFEGTGIGLAIVQRIVQRHGGRVWAESELDRGATFYLFLEEQAV